MIFDLGFQLTFHVPLIDLLIRNFGDNILVIGRCANAFASPIPIKLNKEYPNRKHLPVSDETQQKKVKSPAYFPFCIHSGIFISLPIMS